MEYRHEIADGGTLGSVIRVADPECCVAVIRPGTQEREKTENIQVITTAGEITIEISVPGIIPVEDGTFISNLSLHWEDRYSAAFGPFSREFVPDRRAHLYERADVILGCGGYDPKQSYLIFSRLRHSADHGAGADGGVIGRVVSGRGVIDRWKPGDRVTGIIPVIAWADTTRSFTTTDKSLILEDGMQIVSHVEITVQGYSRDHIDPAAALSVEHLLLATAAGEFRVFRAANTHIFDRTWSPNDVPMELERPRREGSVTVRTRGQSRGGVYIYTSDVPSSQFHTLVGQVTHGIELAKLAKEQDKFSIEITPAMLDLLGLPLDAAEDIAGKRNIAATVDDRSGGDRIVVGQEPRTTMEVLAQGSVAIATRPVSKVIDIDSSIPSPPIPAGYSGVLADSGPIASAKSPHFLSWTTCTFSSRPYRKASILFPRTPRSRGPRGIARDDQRGTETGWSCRRQGLLKQRVRTDIGAIRGIQYYRPGN